VLYKSTLSQYLEGLFNSMLALYIMNKDSPIDKMGLISFSVRINDLIVSGAEMNCVSFYLSALIRNGRVSVYEDGRAGVSGVIDRKADSFS